MTPADNSQTNPKQELGFQKRRNTLKLRLKTNLPQKLIALLTSLILFAVVMSDRNMTLTFEKIPLTLQIPEGYALRGDPSIQTTDIKIYGRASILRHITRDDLGSASVNAPAREGNIQITLNDTMLSIPDGVSVERFQPEFVGVDLEAIAKRTVTISTDHALTGNLLPGYQLGEIRLTPSEIELIGPRSLIEETSQIYIEPIDLTGKAAPFVVTRWAILNRVGLKTTSSAEIQVSVEILSKSRQQRILGVPLEPLNLSRAYEFIPPSLDLTLIGDEHALSQVEASRLFITVDAKTDQEGPAHIRIIERSEIVIRNLPPGVGVDETRLPTLLLSVGSRDSKRPIGEETPVPKIASDLEEVSEN